MKTRTNQRGVIMIGAFMVTAFFMITSLAVAEMGVSHYTSSRRSLVALGAISGAEAGADAFMQSINSSTTYQGTNSAPANSTNSCTFTPAPVMLQNNNIQGKITYESCVQDGSIAGEKIVYATGKVYLPATSTSPLVTRKVKLIINQATSPNYSVMSGPGGLTLGNNVRITTGPVFVGGKLIMGNNSSIGSAASPVSTYVADLACPNPATAAFPSACSSGNSITTGSNAHVYGDTHPLNSVDAPSKFTDPGIADHIVPAITMPIVDHNTVTNGISGGGTIASLSCSGGTAHLSGHYTGTSSSSWSVPNNCTVILDANTWFDGSLALGNNSRLTVNSALATAPNLILDGSDGFVTGNNNFITANASGVGINIYTFWSADTTCRPNCANVTGTALASSQGITTINLDNNVSGSANIKFYARWTQLVLGNNATVGQLMAQSIVLNNNGDIQFSNSSGGTPSGWDVRYYEQLHN